MRPYELTHPVISAIGLLIFGTIIIGWVAFKFIDKWEHEETQRLNSDLSDSEEE